MRQGIDVSHHNGKLDWAAIAKGGVTFAYAKATEGVGFTDPQFPDNRLGMLLNSISAGAYHFFHPAVNPEAQADYFCKAMPPRFLNHRGIVASHLPPALDVEETSKADEWAAIPKEDRADLILRWLTKVEANLGVRPILYTRHLWLDTMIPDVTDLLPYSLWVAQYTADPDPILPKGWNSWLFWQYTDKGTLPGVPGLFDLDRANDTSA